MKVAVCCIVKMENKYIREWVEHYKSINVDNIILYDNNDSNGENLFDVISDYINNGYVIIEDCKDKNSYQCIAYIHCYNKYRKNYNWICLFDADEFLDVKDIKEFLSNDKFNNYNCIRVCWRLFDDNNIIETNGDYSLMKRFKSSKPCRQVKSIINTSLDTYIGWMTPHGPLKVKCCDVNGDPCWSDNEFIGESIKDKKYKVFLNHYYMKTLEEYIMGKMKRLYPDQDKQSAQNILRPERFFMINKLTTEKIEWLKKHGIILKMKNGEVDYIKNKSFYENWFK